MKSKYKDLIRKLRQWIDKHDELLLKLEDIDDDEQIEQLKKEYVGYVSIFDFKEHCTLDHAELRKESPLVWEWLGLPDYFWELEGEIGKEYEEGKVIGFEWFLDDICYILEKDRKRKYIPVNMKLTKL